MPKHSKKHRILDKLSVEDMCAIGVTIISAAATLGLFAIAYRIICH